MAKVNLYLNKLDRRCFFITTLSKGEKNTNLNNQTINYNVLHH